MLPVAIQLRLLGSLAAVPSRDEEEFVHELRSLPEGWFALAGLLLIAALCWSVIWMYRREARTGASRGMRLVLGGVRSLVLILLAVILLEPVRVRILRRWVDSYTVVLIDDSSSMGLADRYRDPEKAASAVRLASASGEGAVQGKDPVQRKDIVRSLLAADNNALLKGLAANNRVKVYRFSDVPEHLGTIKADRERDERSTSAAATASGDDEKAPTADASQLDFRLFAAGGSTNVERAVRRAVESLGSSPVAGIIIFSDGGFNAGGAVEDVAAYAAQRRLPIHTVGVGDPSPPRNVRIVSVEAPENAFKQDPFAITAEISTQGLTGETIQVMLYEGNLDVIGDKKLIETRNVTAAGDGMLPPVMFERHRDQTGRFLYDVQVAELEAESVTDDNAKQASVNVIESRTRVLVVSGGPSWDYRYVTRLLERDDTFDVSCWLQSADASAVRDGDTIIDHLPRLAEELFEYDVILLMDPDRAEIDNEWCRLAETLVSEHGAGLMYASARAHTPDFMRDKSLAPLQDMLPVVFDPEADLILNRVGHYQLKASPVEIPDEMYGHPILRMADDPASSRLVWQSGNNVYWHYPVSKPKPVATVLMQHGDPSMRNSRGPHVLAAVQYVGAGRTAFMAFDGSWRWRRLTPERFDRYWVQMVRFLAEGKLLGGARRGLVLTESDQYGLGDAVTVDVRLYDRRFKPLTANQVTAEIEFAGQETDLVLSSRKERAGWYRGQFVPDRIGNYRVIVPVPTDASGEPEFATKNISVSRPNLEIVNPQMNRAALVALAEGSEGGSYSDFDQLAGLADLIPDKHEEISIRSRPTSLWDNSFVLAVLIGLLAIEWAARKWCRLL